MRADDALRRAAERLEAAGVENARREARLLLAEAAGLTPAQVLTDPGRGIDPAPLERLVARRAAREPMALILGWQEFWSLRFAVSRETLIPRADSETLIEAALAEAGPVGRVLDLGTGTGCLLLAALSEFRDAWGVGVDVSPGAAGLAASNARALRLDSRARFVCADWASAFARLDADRLRFDLVLCNPPYIRHAECAGLMPEVAAHEPAGALDGGADGLVAYRRIMPELPRLLAPGGLAILELGQGQAERVAALAAGLTIRTVRRDLAGLQRAMVLQSGLVAPPHRG